MSDKEQEALARQLYALYWEAIGVNDPKEWNALLPVYREAWIQLAQYIEATYINPVPDHR